MKGGADGDGPAGDGEAGTAGPDAAAGPEAAAGADCSAGADEAAATQTRDVAAIAAARRPVAGSLVE